MKKAKGTKFHSAQNALQNFRMIKMKQIKIGQKEIGEGKPCFIIAEAGVNHNGKLSIAKKLVDAAVEAGVDAVKFQAFKSKDLVTKTAEMASYQQKNLSEKITQQKMLKKYEASQENLQEFKKYCDEKNIIFLVTPHTESMLELVEKLSPALKIGSGDLTNLPFLKKAASKGKPLIVATGMSTMEEAKQALEAIHETGNKQVVMLHCTSMYPCPLGKVNLNAMKTMQNNLDCLIGYSDHTKDSAVPIMAIALGACVIEKHFTIDKKMTGPDQKASLDPKELAEMVKDIRQAEKIADKSKGKEPKEIAKLVKKVSEEDAKLILGSSEKKPNAEEIEIAKLVRKSVVSGKDIEKNETIAIKMLEIKRPGTGILPSKINELVGKKARKKIPKDTVIEMEMLEHVE